MLRPAVLFATLLIATVSAAASALTPPALPRPSFFPVRIESPRAASPIRLQKLSITTEISGAMAETTVRMVLFNPNARALEGTLQFPLLDGQQITAFALDIDGAMRPAVPVEKAKGREVFEAIQRGGIDPGLLEVTQGNNFKLRIFPINGGATRTAEIRYAEPLRRERGEWHYRLPLEYGKADGFDLTLKVNGRAVAPSVTGLRELAFAPVEDGYRATFSEQGFDPSGSVDIALGVAEQARSYRQQFNGETYFVAEVPVATQRKRRAPPRVLGLLWDSSGSGARRQLQAELAVLERYFKAVGEVEVRLTRLRDHAEPARTFRVSGGQWAELRRELEATVYDGASALADWQSDSAVDEYLLFSDGLSNYGPARMPQLAPRQRLSSLNSASAADSARLAGIAAQNGGELIAIDAAAPAKAADRLLFEAARVRDIQAEGATDVVVESRSVHDGLLRVAGRLLQPGQLTITLSDGGIDKTVTVPLTADLPAHPLAAHTWARLRLRMLEADPEAHRGEISRLGRKFSIPTRETSLIVLERLEDYLSYDIEPPAKLAKAYAKRRQVRASGLASERRQHIEQVVQQFQERLAWYQRDFPKTPPKPPKAVLRPQASAPAELILESREPRPMLQAAPPPPPMLAPMARLADSRAVAAAPAFQPPPAPANGSPSAPRAGAGHTGIGLAPWRPNAPYAARLRKASAQDVYALYLDEKPSYENSTAFFLDAADVLLEKGQRDLALRVLSNLAEMELENRAALRILGYRLMQAGAPRLAVPIFEQVLRIAQEEPQSWRDLGLALAAAGQPQQAIDKLHEIALRPWDARFPGIESIALTEMNAIIATAQAKLDTRLIDPRLLKNLPLALRVVMTWDADNTDIDLHVTDPSGEVASFSNPLTRQGGRMSSDFTGGYGPEEFALRSAMPGKYRVHAQFYGNRQQVLAGATTLQLSLVSGFGTRASKEKSITLRLKDQGDHVFVGEFEVTASGVR